MDRTTIYRRPTGLNLFEKELTVEALSEMGNPLERLSGRVGHADTSANTNEDRKLGADEGAKANGRANKVANTSA